MVYESSQPKSLYGPSKSLLVDLSDPRVLGRIEATLEARLPQLLRDIEALRESQRITSTLLDLRITI